MQLRGGGFGGGWGWGGVGVRGICGWGGVNKLGGGLGGGRGRWGVCGVECTASAVHTVGLGFNHSPICALSSEVKLELQAPILCLSWQLLVERYCGSGQLLWEGWRVSGVGGRGRGRGVSEGT